MQNIKDKKKLRVAAVGCLHGNLNDTYDAIKSNEIETGEKVDILLCCGDFESLRQKEDLRYMSCPEKYKHMGQFHNYFLSSTPAPVLTIFIGGNHEASNVLDENFYSGWICENIFYLGRAGVINYKGIRIAGLSGIFKKFDYFKGHFETDLIQDIKSIFHVREFEIAKLSHLNNTIDILMTHDWPTGCVHRKDINKISKIKYHWKEELQTDTLGSPASGFLLKILKPKFFLSGHMHFTYFNEIKHTEGGSTQFIALDKAGTKGKRYYLHFFDYPIDDKVTQEEYEDEDIYFDPQWVEITKIFNPYIPLTRDNFDFSHFVVNSTGYLNCLNAYGCQNYQFKVGSVPDSEFVEKINEFNKLNFTENQDKFKIKFDKNELNYQRDSIVKLLKIDDYHKSKIKCKVNKEEIEINFDF